MVSFKLNSTNLKMNLRVLNNNFIITNILWNHSLGLLSNKMVVSLLVIEGE